MSLTPAEQAALRRAGGILALRIAAMENLDSFPSASEWGGELLAIHLATHPWPALWSLPPHQALRAEMEFLSSYPVIAPLALPEHLEKYAAALLLKKASLPSLLRLCSAASAADLLERAVSQASRDRIFLLR